MRSPDSFEESARLKVQIKPRAKGAIEALSPRKWSHFIFEISNLRFENVLPNLCLSVDIFLASCGYHVGGTASRLPPGLKMIAVPALENRTNQYRVEQRMTQAVVREFLARTKYRIVSSEDSADAVLHGVIT